MSDATTEQPSYEEAREELIEVVRTLEAGGTTLEESLALWERGEALAKVCQQWLDGARKRLDEAMGTEPTTDPSLVEARVRGVARPDSAATRLRIESHERVGVRLRRASNATDQAVRDGRCATSSTNGVSATTRAAQRVSSPR